ncbi:substrate-binding domain-containing protein [Paenibacillus sp. P25]|nr:substrate-binding domain-containing protein [Paenibacillus sp. P25]
MLKRSGIPFVLIDQKLEEMESHQVRGDNFSGAVSLVTHLWELGHRRIAVVSPQKHYTHRERIKGYRFALMDHDVKVPEGYEVLQEQGDDYLGPLNRSLDRDDKPTALFVTAPNLLGGIIGLLREKQMHIPQDLSVVTFDDTYASLPEGFREFFTSVNQPGKLMGSMAVELLFQHLRNPEMEYQEIVLPGKLSVRQSTRVLSTP